MRSRPFSTTVSHHDIAAIWVAFFSRCQRYRCGQEQLTFFALAKRAGFELDWVPQSSLHPDFQANGAADDPAEPTADVQGGAAAAEASTTGIGGDVEVFNSGAWPASRIAGAYPRYMPCAFLWLKAISLM